MYERGFGRLCAALLSALLLLQITTPLAAAWTTSAVGEPEVAIWQRTVHDVDGNGRDYVVFAGQLSNKLHYRTNLNGQWSARKTVSTGFEHQPWSVDVTAGGKMYVLTSRYNPTSDTEPLYWMTNASGSWVRRPAEAEAHRGKSFPGLQTSAIVVFKGRVSILYSVHLPNNTSELYLRNIFPGGTSNTRRLMAADEFQVADLAVDGEGKLHVVSGVLHNGQTWGIRYFTNRSGAWAGTWLDDSGGQVGVAAPQLAVSGSGRAHVVYTRCYDADCGVPMEHIVYANNVGGPWHEVREFPVEYAPRPDIAYGGKQKVFIASRDSGAPDYYSAIRVRDNVSGSWRAKSWFHGAVANSVVVEVNDPIIRAVGGRPHVAYVAENCCSEPYWRRIYVRLN